MVWFRREGANEVLLQRSPVERYSLYGHVVALEELAEEDSGLYCCQVEGLYEDCVQLVVLEEGTPPSAPLK